MTRLGSTETRFDIRRPSPVAIFTAGAAACMVLAAIPGCGVQEHPHGSAPVAPVSSGGSPAITGTGGNGASTTSTGGQGVSGSGGVSPGNSGGAGPGNGTGGTGPVATGGAQGSGSGGGPAGTVSGITININGTMVPKEKAIVFIHFGHSNMQGQATKPASLQPFFYTTQPQLWVYRGANTFVLAKEPTAPQSAMDTRAGPGMALLKTAAAAAPADYHFISIGRGQGSAPSPDFLKANNLLYPTVMNRALELKGKVTFGAIFVMLGITERHLPAAEQPGFPMRIKQIIADMRADLGEPNIPVLFCDYEQEAKGDLAPTGAVGVTVMPMVRSLPGLITNLVLVPTDMLGMMDDHHFDFAGHKLWSERAIAIMQNHQPTWFPWMK